MAASSPPRNRRAKPGSELLRPSKAVRFLPAPDAAAQPQHSTPVLWKRALETMELWQLGCTRGPPPSVGLTRGAHTWLGCVSPTFCSATGAGKRFSGVKSPL